MRIIQARDRGFENITTPQCRSCTFVITDDHTPVCGITSGVIDSMTLDWTPSMECPLKKDNAVLIIWAGEIQ